MAGLRLWKLAHWVVVDVGIKELRNGCQRLLRTCAPSCQPAAHRLDVLLRHRLLREARGSQSLSDFRSPKTENLGPDYFPNSDLPRKERTIVDPGVGARHPTRKTPQN